LNNLKARDHLTAHQQCFKSLKHKLGKA